MKSRPLLLVVVLSQLTCHQVIFHAPPGTTMGCQANPPAIAAFNGVSVISCILQEEIGTPVADGTVVQFFTNLGRIQEQGKTNDGVVRVNLQADGRSGLARVRAISGGGTIPSSSSSVTVTTQPGGSAGTGVGASSDLSASSSSSSSSSSAVMADASVDVTIGNAAARQVVVTANPTRIVESRSTHITAAVYDEFGNPVAGVPVIFTIGEAAIVGPAPTSTPVATATPVGTATPGPTSTPGPTATSGPTATPLGPGGDLPTFEHMDSQGTPIFTDSNGRASDVMRTRYPREAAQRRVVVFVTIPGPDLTGSVTVFIN